MTSSGSRARWWRSLRWPGARRRANPDGTMTLVEHIYEFRRRLAIALLAVALGTALGFVWYTSYPFGLPSLGQILTEPYCALPPENRVQLGGGEQCRLVAFGVFEQFVLRLQVAATAGALLSSPIWFAQIWGFITPGLYAKEKRFAYTFVTAAVVLFTAGAVLAYFVVTQALQFLFTIGGDIQATVLRGSDYFSLLLALLIIFGVSFELPLLVIMLNRVGVISYDQLKRWRRGLVFGLFVFAAVATPGQDPISMLALGVSLVLLLEFAIQVARVHDKRAARRRLEQGWDGLDPDQPSPLDDRLGAPAPPAGPAPRIEPVPPPAADRGSDTSSDRWDVT
ncbi:sec-independent protein translocase protein TatC [Actinomycetospora succinea]|uniref:Sec-independent protein translocase protein TatC n=1 Tax=Actinomycetospora succinea TaxID=663603 RepID=A0A4R6V678_9PSEU|nr:twin-arginine translocase subunit TatC [Actinomycetospora succinea]TDQ51714.1 sec-independent protein translocase protein TatC [Actinomycetospora succinea]